MPREWHPLRFFVREDGRPHPTILFWLFLVPAFIIVLAGCYLMADSRGRQEATAALLTRTPTLEVATIAPTGTNTPPPPTGVPQPTQFVYDNPEGWEFVEKTDPTGKTYLDLQDWQKQQVWHAFRAFWDIYNHNDAGLPDWSELQKYIAGSFVGFARGDYDAAIQSGRYIYLVEGLDDIPHRAMVLESTNSGGVKVKVILGMDRSYQVQYRDIHTGAILEEGSWLPYATWDFIMAFQDDKWVVEQESHELFSQ